MPIKYFKIYSVNYYIKVIKEYFLNKNDKINYLFIIQILILNIKLKQN